MKAKSCLASEHGGRTLPTEGMCLRVVSFVDGSSCRLGRIRGGRFEPAEDERFLFEFPDGNLRVGTVSPDGLGRFLEHLQTYDGVFDSQSKTLALKS